MCLTSIKETYDIPCTLITDGWKQFSGTDKKPQFQAYAYGGSKDVPLDRWLTAKDEHAKRVDTSDCKGSYAPGFHVYADEPKNKLGYRRVFVRRITCMGQDGQRTVIAQEMYVPSDQNGWPPKDTDFMSRVRGIVGEA